MMREVMFSCHSCIHYFGKWQVRLLYSHSLFSHLHLEPVIHISSPPATAFPLGTAMQMCLAHGGRKLSLKMLVKGEHRERSGNGMKKMEPKVERDRSAFEYSICNTTRSDKEKKVYALRKTLGNRMWKRESIWYGNSWFMRPVNECDVFSFIN